MAFMNQIPDPSDQQPKQSPYDILVWLDGSYCYRLERERPGTMAAARPDGYLAVRANSQAHQMIEGRHWDRDPGVPEALYDKAALYEKDISFHTVIKNGLYQKLYACEAPGILDRAQRLGYAAKQAIEQGVSLKGANLEYMELSDASLRGVDFSCASLGNVKLLRCDMVHALLEGSVLYGIDLTGTNLQGAKFKNAVLTHANFTNANLENADFTDVITIYGANFTGAHIDRTHGLKEKLRDKAPAKESWELTDAEIESIGREAPASVSRAPSRKVASLER
ncbi:MAG: pentapeptide repeat-containing protein [Burkholderiaceae bacterium]|nr:pentapeptide repeat-containing protein [Burkholderiaceae bacterium]